MNRNTLGIIFFCMILQGCFEEYKSGTPIEKNIQEIKSNYADKAQYSQVSRTPTVEEILDTEMFYSPQERDPFALTGYFDLTAPSTIYYQEPLVPVRVAIDPSRPLGYKAGPFEKYELKQLTMIGIVYKSDGTPAAIIDVGNNKTIVVHEGDYIGKDHGRVTEIEEKRVKVEEKYGSVQEGPDAWLILPNEIQLRTQ